MELLKGTGDHGLANRERVVVRRRGHRLSAGERVEIMRGLDNELSYAEIGKRIGVIDRWSTASISATVMLMATITP